MTQRTLTRAALADAIEAAIAALDAFDGEPDFEPDNEDGCYAEDDPRIGLPNPYVRCGAIEDDELSLGGVTVDPWHLRKHHDDGDREGPDDDAEPTLGSGAVNFWEHQGNWARGRNVADGEDEPSLGSVELHYWCDTQERWSHGGRDDREHETADFEHSMGWGNPHVSTNQTHEQGEGSDDREPSLSASCPTISQSRWGREAAYSHIVDGEPTMGSPETMLQTGWTWPDVGDVDEREPDSDLEPSLGWTVNGERGGWEDLEGGEPSTPPS